MSTRFRKPLCIRDAGDCEVGNFVKWAGRRGTGIIASPVQHGFVWVSWAHDRRDYLPVTVLRPVKFRGEQYDRRGPE